MLVLSRRVGETLQIGDNVSLTVLSVSGRQVRIGVTAPQSVQVLRGELHEDPRPEQAEVQPGT